MVKNKKDEGILDAVNHKLDDMKFRMILGFLAVLQFAAVFLNSYSHVSFGVQTKTSAAAGKYDKKQNTVLKCHNVPDCLFVSSICLGRGRSHLRRHFLQVATRGLHFPGFKPHIICEFAAPHKPLICTMQPHSHLTLQCPTLQILAVVPFITICFVDKKALVNIHRVVFFALQMILNAVCMGYGGKIKNGRQ